MSRTGHYAILDQLLADGVTKIFGNPGTVEQGLLDALEDRPGLSYVLTLQESIAIYAADAYARASGGLAVAQIHSSPGLGNALGAMYQANRGHSPILVLGGDSGIRYQAMEAQMAADLVAMARPVTKWSTMVQHPTSLLRVLRRAIKIALTPPMGPVYVCLPQDMLDEISLEEVFATCIPDSRVMPRQEMIDSAAKMLLSAARPTIYIGDGVLTKRFESRVPPTVPVTILFGDSDNTLPYPGSQEKSLAPSHGTWVVLDSCGHAPMWDYPSLVVDSIQKTASR